MRGHGNQLPVSSDTLAAIHGLERETTDRSRVPLFARRRRVGSGAEGSRHRALVSLHAVWHGVEAPCGAEDVRRAVACLGLTGWRQAAELAAALGCLEAFTAGLHTVSEGHGLAERLGLDPVIAPELRARLGDRPPTSLAWLDLFRTRRSARELASVLLRELVPSVDEIRRQSSREISGHAALIMSYAARLVRLAATAPRGIVAARRALRGQHRE